MCLFVETHYSNCKHTCFELYLFCREILRQLNRINDPDQRRDYALPFDPDCPTCQPYTIISASIAESNYPQQHFHTYNLGHHGPQMVMPGPQDQFSNGLPMQYPHSQGQPPLSQQPAARPSIPGFTYIQGPVLASTMRQTTLRPDVNDLSEILESNIVHQMMDLVESCPDCTTKAL
ncbi:hypothetical protein E8E15_006542 [Penicillium rubens]|jgi:hypothetical protein|uniref:Uncharacterized protein n=1 Tax=Penicillium chrysogenum TaxID=5076 RepID=A0A167WW05_PENCH|nr:uncharacterized protein N7525_000579 [Penicillium rubens]KZN92122.1 hypothetical protein EN45_022690 [Penicillium chrysogenum]KAF3020430.1 hypothetical protein E8E15_006542 [Penicillium rubens]KAJ5039690.1 hypothetical protein NUH16_009476 [Penicillium rubens]KAJ5842838.1 hypothetical protein N7525_000579 [Penicillium rubens]KAJ5846585.1 hypothetical protein N7534_010254 [Penicillium rubens]